MPVHVAEVLGGLGQQLRDLPDLIQRLLAAEVAELSGDGQLEDLLIETVAANVETWFSTLRYDIPIAIVRLDSRKVPAKHPRCLT